jgi:hypothetical protein
MATVKNITDSYTINTPLVTISGNLNVLGNTTTIRSTQLTVDDNIITLNGNVTGVPTLNAGIAVNRGSSANVYVLWNESIDSWQITNNGTTYGNILNAVNGSSTLPSNLVIQNTTVAPTATAGHNTVYAQTPNGGGSGLYITNTTYTTQELITRVNALIYTTLL